MVYHVGRPAMFDGNMFLPEAGTPERSIDRSRTMLAVWLPEPLTVAIWMLKSLTTRCAFPDACCSCTARSVGDILKSLRRMKIQESRRSSAAAGQPQKYITHERTPWCNGERTGARDRRHRAWPRARAARRAWCGAAA